MSAGDQGKGPRYVRIPRDRFVTRAKRRRSEPQQIAAHRVGEPSPLIFHLSVALSSYAQALVAAPGADSAAFPWAEDLRPLVDALGPDLDQVEVARQVGVRLQATMRGLEIWQCHPYRRVVREPPAIWKSGSTRLLDYGQVPEASDPHGPAVLVVPSLINRAYILDLAPGRSMLRWMASVGLRPLLVDWGAPGRSEMRYGLNDYGSERLLPALETAVAAGGGPVPVVGYCMGGTLAAGLTARAPALVSRLATIGAPWAFQSAEGISGSIRAMIRSNGQDRAVALLRSLSDAFGLVPVSLFQFLFALVNPMQAALKFQKLARLDPEGQTARLFVALEDWLADGVPMAGPAAEDLLIGWHIRNETVRRQWQFLGGAVDPGNIQAPTLAFCGRTDSIAPPALSQALPAAIPGAQILTPATGHVGMVVSTAARTTVWRPLAGFLRQDRERAG